MTRRKRTGPAGKRTTMRSSGIALYSETGEWLGKFDVDTMQVTTPKGTHSQEGTKSHTLRVTMALKWIAENRPDLLAHVTQEETSEETQ